MQVQTSGVRDGLGEVKDVDEGKREVLVTIPWEVLDTYNTDFSRDCFDEYLGQRMPAMCWQHDKNEPIGSVKSHSKGSRANEFVAGFSDFDAVPRARQAFVQIRDGDLKDFSFYYDQAKATAHPQTRGALRFTKARMPEISPVTVGSIPGAIATGVRSAADAAGIAELIRTQVITPEEGRAMLGVMGEVPVLDGARESITIHEPSLAESIAEALIIAKAAKKAGKREAPAEPVDDGDDLMSLAGAVDAAIGQAAGLLDGKDLTGLDPDVQQALALYSAAGVANDAMLDAMGVPALVGTDDGGRSATTEPLDLESAEGERATVSDKTWPIPQSEYTPAQWKTACLIVDGDGSTMDQCSLPVKEPDGTLNKNGVVSAAKMIGHVKGASDADLQAAAKTLMGLLNTVGEKPTPSVLALASGKRSADVDAELVTDEAEAALKLLHARLAS